MRGLALPAGAQITHGNADFAQQAHQLNIHQTTPTAVIQWDGFNIATSESVNFQQPSATSMALNRILSPTASEIYGKLSSNGQIFLINPNGILFGPDAQVNAGSLVASSLNMSDEDFLSGHYLFSNTGGKSISNAGHIAVSKAGYAALIGPEISNGGTIEGEEADLYLTSASEVEIRLAGSKLLGMRVERGVADGFVKNGGIVRADGGKIVMTAKGLDALNQAVVNNEGIIEAKSITTREGEIYLSGDQVVIPTGAQISANAEEYGDGGKIIVWSEKQTIAKGQLSARGGKFGGNGGWIETSSHGVLDANDIQVDTRAQQGKVGTWLLDPNDVTIQTTGPDSGVTGNPNFTMTGSATSVLTVATLTTALASSNASVTTGGGTEVGGHGDITVANALTWSSANTLTLTSVNNIYLNAAITATNGSLVLNAKNASQSITSGSEASPSATGVTSAISVENFNLTQGQWFQNNPTLPTFTVSNNFQLASGAAAPSNIQFLRVTGGAGTAGSPYQLAGVYGLQGINSSTTFLGNAWQMNGNIDATVTANWNGGAGFVPIGPQSGTAFSGVFNGQNNTISHLTINRSSTNYVGLFSEVTGGGGTIENVSLGGSIAGAQFTGALAGLLIDGSINNVKTSASVVGSGNNVGGTLGGTAGGTISNSCNSGAVSGVQAVGGIVGALGDSDFNVHLSTLSSCTNSGSVTGTGTGTAPVNNPVGGLVGTNGYTVAKTAITNSNNTGVITQSANGAYTGGLIGYNYGKNSSMSNCYNSGAVNGGAGGFTGGAIGLNGAVASGFTTNASYNTGAVSGGGGANVGGFVGQNNSAITNSYSTGPVTNGSTIGGFAGSNTDTLTNVYSGGGSVSGTAPVGGLVATNTGTVTNSFWDTQASGQATSAAGTGKTTAQMMMQSTYTGWDFASTWGIVAGSSYPYLLAAYATAPTVISSTSSATGGQSAKLVVNGAVIDTTTTTASGFVQFLEGNNAIGGCPINNSLPAGTPFLIYLSNAGVEANLVSKIPTGGGSVTGLAMTTNTLQLGGPQPISLSNSDLSTVLGGLSISDILYSASSNNITVGNATHTVTNLDSTATTTFTMNGTIAPTAGGSGSLTMNGPTVMNDTSVTSNGTQTYNAAVTISSNTALTSTNNAVAFNSTIDSTTSTPESLTVTAGTGALNFNGVIGGVNPLNNFTASTTGTATVTVPSITAAGNILVTSTNTSSGIIISSGATMHSTAASGTTITLVGHTFTNNSNASALNPGGGSFQVWSTNPTLDTHNGLTSNFIQYGATYPTSTVLGTGNGFLYSVSPVVTPGLIGTVSKQYNGTTVATLALANYTVSGVLDGDTVTLNNPITGTYDTRNVGTGKTVSVSGISIASAVNGSATIFGYTLSSTSASAAIGTITTAPLTVSANVGQSKVYGTSDPNSAKTAYSVTSGTLYSPDTLTGNMGRVSGENVGSYNFTKNTVAVSDGNSGNNYTLTFNGNTNPFQITKAPLTASIVNQTKVYGTNDPAISGIAVTLGGIVNTSVTDINGNVTSINDTGHVSTTLASLTRTAGELVSGSPYAITASTFNALTGSAAGNYSTPTGLTGSPILTITKAPLTASIANQSKVYGSNDPTISGIAVNLAGIVNTSVTNWNGSVTPMNDTGNVATTLVSLTRTAGELVSGSPYAITASTLNALTGSASGNYSASPSLTGSPTLTITKAPLTASIANQSKVYGSNDPAISGITMTLGGIVNTSVTNWNGSVTPINDTGNVTTTLASLTRTAGELVSGSPYSITASTFNALTGSASGNYSAPTSLTGSPTLTISKAPLTASIANQSKVYGSNDPAISGITMTLGGIVNTSVTNWNGTVTPMNDAGNVSTTLASLTRTAGELVSGSPYAITASIFNALTGSASGNYSAPTSLTGSPTLTITKAPLTASIVNQSKVYGTNDPAISGITVTLGGIINTSVTNWNGSVTPINDTGNVSTTLASLTRTAGELVSGSPYSITASTFNALTGSAAGNYSTPTGLTGSPTLTITKAPLTASIVNQSKVYGSNDPALSGIAVNLAGIVNTSVTNWNGTVTPINDTGNVSATLASLTRIAGELVSGSPYAITASTLNALTGSASGNYSAPTSLTGSPTLTITQAPLTASMVNQSKVYGSNDPALSGIAVTLGGIVNTSVTNWNGTVTSMNDTGHVLTTLASLTRTAGELVSGSPYSITASTFNALSGSAAGNYLAPNSLTGSPTLTITGAPLTASMVNQSKVRGTNDPAISGIAVTLGGIVNTSVTTWNGTVTPINDTGHVLTTLASLTRVAGELVSGSPYSITAATFNALTGSAAGNYLVPSSLTGSPTLTITRASLTASIVNQSKVYGTNDPALSGIAVNLAGIVNTSVTNWNGTVTPINDTGHVLTTLASLTRVAGELVSGSPYAITGSIVNALTGSMAGNYTAPTSLTGSPTLTITTALLTQSIANQAKVYGSNDPALSGIGVILIGIVNTSITNWDGMVTPINDTGNVTTTLTSLTRVAGEAVNNSPYAITAGTFNPLTGSAAGNYSAAPGLTGSPTLTITPTPLTASIADQTKVYGTNDPVLSGIGVILGGVVNTSATDWNGDVTPINDTGNVVATLASLTRLSGELVDDAPYAITDATYNPLTGSAADNYTVPLGLTNTPELNITPVPLTASISDQTKVYGTDDPALSGIGVILGGVVNTSVADWNGDVTPINDTGNVVATLASLTRLSGETVDDAPYAITDATYNPLTGNAADNYFAPLDLTNTPVLNITPAPLIASIEDQTKVYGTNDPDISGIGVILGGVVNTSVTDWNGDETSIDDNSNVSTTLASLTRIAGETVDNSPYTITDATYNPLTGSAADNYTAPLDLTNVPILTITPAPLTASMNNQTKVYGTNDPAISGIVLNLGGIVNTSVTDWNGDVTSMNDTGNVATTLASLTRVAGELVSGNPYGIIGATFNPLIGSAADNYTAPLDVTGSPILTITPASLTASMNNQSKVYGTNDPALSGIGVNLAGIVNTSVTNWNGSVTTINDTGNVSTTLASLTRVAGETVSGNPYSITGATFNPLIGSAAGNYSVPIGLTGSPTLTITPVLLTASINNQSKVYGTNNPALSGIGVILGGIVNTSVTNWNGSVTPINDIGNVSTTLVSLTRVAGELVSGSPYAITAPVFHALTGSAVGNYTAPTALTGSPTLTITPASLTASMNNQSKVYGTNDPALSGIGVNLGGIVNRSITNWNGTVTLINDTGHVATTLASLARVAGELVSGSPYAIIAATYNPLTGSAAGNYTAPLGVTGSPTLTITQASLTASMNNQSKVYGTNDPAMSGIGVNLAGIVNTSVTNWNGAVTPMNDTGNVSTTLASLTRVSGENVNTYAIAGATLQALTGSAAGNYTTSSSLTGSPTLTITRAGGLTASIGNHTKTYGTNDPLLRGIAVSLSGLINTSVTDWNGNTTVINDTQSGEVTASLASLARVSGESVAGSPYSITVATFNALGGAHGSNYLLPSLTGTSNLTITPAALTVIANSESKLQSNPDPPLTDSTMGLVNTTVTDWNGIMTTINNTPSNTLSGSLTRVPGEAVGTYSILQGSLALISTNYTLTYVPGIFTILSSDPPSPTIIDLYYYFIPPYYYGYLDPFFALELDNWNNAYDGVYNRYHAFVRLFIIRSGVRLPRFTQRMSHL